MAYSPLINRTLMSTIAQVKQQVERIWYASFQTDLADTLAAELRRHALAGVPAALETARAEALEPHRQHARPAPPRLAPALRHRSSPGADQPWFHPRPARAQAAARHCRASLACPHALSLGYATAARPGTVSLPPRPLHP